MKCNVCGKELNEKDKFCAYCGHKINGKKKPFYFWIMIGVALISLTSLICYICFKDKDNSEVVVTPEENKVSFNGVNVVIPKGLGYEVSGKNLILSAADGSWFIDIGIMDGNYDNLKKNRNMLKNALLSTSDSAKDAEVKNVDDIEFVTIEFTADDVTYLGVYAKLNDSKMITMTFVTTSGEANYELLKKVAPIVSSAKIEN